VPNQYKPAEVAKPDWEAVRQGPPWAVDSWGLGCMMQVRSSSSSGGGGGGGGGATIRRGRQGCLCQGVAGVGYVGGGLW
jgi:hypothetical protein